MLSLLGKMLRDPVYAARVIADRTRVLGARWNGAHDLRWRMKSRQQVFSEIYASQAWGSRESGSGTGSELRATGNLRKNLPELLTRLSAESLLDAPCGDWNWMRHVDLPVTRYFGVDIVPDVVEANRRRFGDDVHRFQFADLTCDSLPRADAILCRDCLVHVSFQDIATILENFRATCASWLLLNTYLSRGAPEPESVHGPGVAAPELPAPALRLPGARRDARRWRRGGPEPARRVAPAGAAPSRHHGAREIVRQGPWAAYTAALGPSNQG